MECGLRALLGHQLIIADGAMGTQIDAAALTPADYGEAPGCPEILNLTRPDVVTAIHQAYLAAGVDAVETNSFGANAANLAEYGLVERQTELVAAAARLARSAADSAGPGHWVFGSLGPGSKLPSLGQISFAELRDGYQSQARALLDGGTDLLMIETCQDLLQAKAAVIGAQRAVSSTGVDAPIWVQITVETSGTMLLGTEPMAAAVAMSALGIDGLGFNCATGPEAMGEHLRPLSAAFSLVSAMPNAGLPEVGVDGAVYPLAPEELAAALDGFVTDLGLALVGGCCGTTPAHLAAVVKRLRGRNLISRPMRSGALAGSVSSLYQAVSLSQETAYLAIGERTNAQGSKAFREAMLADDLDTCLQIGRDQARSGAHLIDLSVDCVGRNGVADMAALAAKLGTEQSLPIMVDSTDPTVIAAALEHLPGRSIVNSVSFEDGGVRLAELAPLLREHGCAVVGLTIDETGQARTAEHKVAVARRLIAALEEFGFDQSDIMIDPLTFPIGSGAAETRRDGLETLAALRTLRADYPAVHLMLGISNISFGLAPAARVVLNSVFLDQARTAGLDAAIVHPARIRPLDLVEPQLRAAALDLIYDRPGQDVDPLTRLMTAGGVEVSAPLDQLDALPVTERLTERIVTGQRAGLEDDLASALEAGSSPFALINRWLLAGMAEVGRRFGDGRTQLPFVLQSAEVMRAAVDWLEPYLIADGSAAGAKGTVVLATVRGDVHDIGKNLVEIICSNNGYEVVNLGIKQPLAAMLAAAAEHQALAIGMSGLLVRSVEVMRENLKEMRSRGLTIPVILGGAALNRRYVESELQPIYGDRVYYAKDAFETLSILNQLANRVGGGETASLEALLPIENTAETEAASSGIDSVNSTARRKLAPLVMCATGNAAESHCPRIGLDAATIAQHDDYQCELSRRDVEAPSPPFLGARRVKTVALDDYLPCLDQRTLFIGRWGLRAGTVELTDQAPARLDELLRSVRTDNLAQAAVAYGYFSVRSDGDDLLLEAPQGIVKWTFPRQQRDSHLALTDFFRPDADIIGLQLVTLGPAWAEAEAELNVAGRYRDYFELHGLGVQLAEALAAYWHQQIRSELGISGGQRFSFGYPACPELAYRRDLMRLLDGDSIGVEITEGDLMVPEQSTDALIVHHPQARHFSPGRAA